MARYITSYNNDSIDNFHKLIDAFFDDDFDVRNSKFKVDVKKNDDDSYTVEAELPGIDKEDISIDAEDDYLTIAVNHDEKEDHSDQENNYVHRERRTYSMSRRIYFRDMDEQNISARLENGLLTLDVPIKKEAVENKKRIEIK